MALRAKENIYNFINKNTKRRKASRCGTLAVQIDIPAVGTYFEFEERGKGHAGLVLFTISIDVYFVIIIVINPTRPQRQIQQKQ